MPSLGVIPVLRVLRDFASLPGGQKWSAVVMPRFQTMSDFIYSCRSYGWLLVTAKQVAQVCTMRMAMKPGSSGFLCGAPARCVECGVVEVIPASAPEVRLSVVQDTKGWLIQAETPSSTVRLVWEVATALSPSSWSVVDVQSDAVGRAKWVRPLILERSSEFLRVRAYDTLGFNARLDRLIREVRATHPEAVLLEANPVLSSIVTELPEWSGLRAVLRVNGGTVVAEQTDLWGDPRMDFRAIPWMGDMDLPWPVAMDLEEAESALRDAGFGSEYRTVTLRRPVYPGMTEPYFIFGTPTRGFIFVGTVTRKVFPGN